ncbi:MAG: DUF3050 domain-containing protein [Opitutae bacterium]
MIKSLVADAWEKLEKHPIFNSLNTLDDLRVFMEHHVYAVWDFMSLLKELQAKLAPHGSPWLPKQNAQVVRLINEIVLEEESDLAIPDMPNVFASHFEIYLNSMKEVGASTSQIEQFLEVLGGDGLADALVADFVPSPARKFMAVTFETIQFGKAHEIAASFAYGRENLVPVMFARILQNFQVSSMEAPLFHYYLERHAQLDGEQHGPMAEKLVNSLTKGNPIKQEEARKAAEKSIEVRAQFWNEVLLAMPRN